MQWRNSRGGGAEGQSSTPETSHLEISADLPRKEREYEKRENGGEKK